MLRQIWFYVFGICLSLSVVALGAENPSTDIFDVARHYNVSPKNLVEQFDKGVISQAFASCKSHLHMCENTSEQKLGELYHRLKIALAYELVCNFKVDDERDTAKLESIRGFIQQPLIPNQFSCNMLWLLTLNLDRTVSYYEVLDEICRRFYFPENAGVLSDEQANFLKSELSKKMSRFL